MMKRIPALLCLLISTSVLADDAALLRCRAIADATARLACYDAIVHAPRSSAPASAAAPASSVAPTAAAPAAAQPAMQTPNQFGFEARDPKFDLKSIQSTIPGRFEGWVPNQRIRLENGQLWQVSDGSSAIVDLMNPKVTISRGSMGTFFLDIEGTNRAPRVKRVQ